MAYSAALGTHLDIKKLPNGWLDILFVQVCHMMPTPTVLSVGSVREEQGQAETKYAKVKLVLMLVA